ncbi:MAG: hypothetical protein RI575_00060 [Balneolaceae bacterium]|nr:hypothetical protein [Balneolaceae bacterium]
MNKPGTVSGFSPRDTFGAACRQELVLPPRARPWAVMFQAESLLQLSLGQRPKSTCGILKAG